MLELLWHFQLLLEEIIQTGISVKHSLNLVSTGNAALHTKHAVTPINNLLEPTQLVIDRNGSNQIPCFNLPVNYVKHLHATLPLSNVIVQVEAPPILLPKDKQGVALDRLPDGIHLLDLNDILVGLEVIVGTVVDLNHTPIHGRHHILHPIHI